MVVQLLIVQSKLHPAVMSRCISGDDGWRTLSWVLRGVLDGIACAVYRPAKKGLPVIAEDDSTAVGSAGDSDGDTAGGGDGGGSSSSSSNSGKQRTPAVVPPIALVHVIPKASTLTVPRSQPSSTPTQSSGSGGSSSSGGGSSRSGSHRDGGAAAESGGGNDSGDDDGGESSPARQRRVLSVVAAPLHGDGDGLVSDGCEPGE